MSEVLTDAKGRKITVRDLTVMDQVKLLRAIGPAQSSNEPYVQIVQAAAGVSEIDGVPIPFPLNERQIDATIARLGDDGVNAIIASQIGKMTAALDAAEAARASEDVKADPLAQPGS